MPLTYNPFNPYDPNWPGRKKPSIVPKAPPPTPNTPQPAIKPPAGVGPPTYIKPPPAPAPTVPKSPPSTGNPYLDFLGRQFFGSEPSAGFYNRFPGAAAPGPRGEFARNRYAQYYQLYLSQLPKNPNLSFYDFLAGKDPFAEFENQAPSARGERQGFYTPNVVYGSGFGGR